VQGVRRRELFDVPPGQKAKSCHVDPIHYRFGASGSARWCSLSLSQVKWLFAFSGLHVRFAIMSAVLAVPDSHASAEIVRRADDPERFAHLVQDGQITLLGFGSLVSEVSARKSFALTDFRLGTVSGYARCFNRADWINMDWGDGRTPTGEVCSVSFVCTGSDAPCRVALMEVTVPEGLKGFLHRESTCTRWLCFE
jgi:hypothetical protein